MKQFNEHLRSIRKDKGYTQRQVANGIGVTERNYQYYESGEREPSMSTLLALADYFDVSLDYLVGRSDEPARR